MSGHSKWHNIQAKKGKADAARGKIFTKIGREIAIAVREGGANPESNGKLRDIIAKAKANNMPNDNIQRSIKKAAGEGSGINYEEIVYEGYAPGGVAVICNIVTDNRNRTSADVRHIFDKCGGNLGAPGSVSYMFDNKGQIVVEREVHIAFSPGAGLGGGLLRERKGAGIQLGGVQRLRFLPLQGGVGFRLILREGHSRAGGVNIP